MPNVLPYRSSLPFRLWYLFVLQGLFSFQTWHSNFAWVHGYPITDHNFQYSLGLNGGCDLIHANQMWRVLLGHLLRSLSFGSLHTSHELIWGGNSFCHKIDCPVRSERRGQEEWHHGWPLRVEPDLGSPWWTVLWMRNTFLKGIVPFFNIVAVQFAPEQCAYQLAPDWSLCLFPAWMLCLQAFFHVSISVCSSVCPPSIYSLFISSIKYSGIQFVSVCLQSPSLVYSATLSSRVSSRFT